MTDAELEAKEDSELILRNQAIIMTALHRLISPQTCSRYNERAMMGFIDYTAGRADQRRNEILAEQQHRARRTRVAE